MAAYSLRDPNETLIEMRKSYVKKETDYNLPGFDQLDKHDYLQISNLAHSAKRESLTSLPGEKEFYRENSNADQLLDTYLILESVRSIIDMKMGNYGSDRIKRRKSHDLTDIQFKKDNPTMAKIPNDGQNKIDKQNDVRQFLPKFEASNLKAPPGFYAKVVISTLLQWISTVSLLMILI